MVAGGAGSHHDFPRIHWQVSVIERPIKFFVGDRLICRVVVWRQVFVSKSISRPYPTPWVEHEHLLQ